MIGRINFWSNRKGFGFIVGPELDEELFCHHSALVEGRFLERDQAVEYEVGEHRGNRCAKNVRKLGGTESAPAAGGTTNGNN